MPRSNRTKRSITPVKASPCFFAAGIFAIAGIIGSCTSSRNDGNNEISAKIELEILMFQIKNNRPVR
jgi:hypothetical protein